VSIAFLVLAARAELLLLPGLLAVPLVLCLVLVVLFLLLTRPRVARVPSLVVVLLCLTEEEEEEDFRGISRLAQHNI
jgi:hypothetical protein